MSIYDALMNDHRAVLALVAKAEKAEGAAQQGLVEQIIDELSAHAMAEEEVFYNTIAASSDDVEELTNEANEEHLSVARLMRDLLSPGLTADRKSAKLSVLREQLEHHIEEEEGEMFTKAKRVVSGEVADALEGQFIAKKMELKDEPLDVRVNTAIAKQEALATGAAGHNKSAPTKPSVTRTPSMNGASTR